MFAGYQHVTTNNIAALSQMILNNILGIKLEGEKKSIDFTPTHIYWTYVLHMYEGLVCTRHNYSILN